MKYKVNLQYKGQTTYVVEANSPAEAEVNAICRWHPGDEGDMPREDREHYTDIYVYAINQ